MKNNRKPFAQPLILVAVAPKGKAANYQEIQVSDLLVSSVLAQLEARTRGSPLPVFCLRQTDSVSTECDTSGAKRSRNHSGGEDQPRAKKAHTMAGLLDTTEDAAEEQLDEEFEVLNLASPSQVSRLSVYIIRVSSFRSKI